MSNRNQNLNQTVENLLFNYLLNYADPSSAGASSPIVEQDIPMNNTNPLSDRTVNSLLRVFDTYQRNVESYHRNMGELINLLRTNMSISRQHAYTPAPVQPTTGQRETRPRSWYVPYSSSQSTTIDPSNNAIPPTNTTRTPTYSVSTATPASSYTLPSRTSRVPTHPNATASPVSGSFTSHLLTHREIERSVSTIAYSSEETETRCPISFEDFCVGERVCKINTCGHIFKREPLYQWLNNHNTCPVCRANVLQPVRSSPANIINEYSNYIAYTLLSGLNTNPSNIQTYTFDIPLYYDTSGNTGSSNISNNYDYIVEEED